MKELIGQFITEWGWLTIVAIFTFAFKDSVTNLVIGAQFQTKQFPVEKLVQICNALPNQGRSKW